MGAARRYGAVCFRARSPQSDRIRLGTRTPVRLFKSGQEWISESHSQVRIGIMANPSVRRGKYPNDCRIHDSLSTFYGV